MKCPACHSDNPSDTRFCENCAAPLPLPQGGPRSQTETFQIPVHELTTGSTFAGRYQIIEELGKGGMGRVYKVFDLKVKEKVALKLIRPEVASDPETLERFSNELKLARKIRHKNVCGMFDLGEAEGAHFITMEYVHGEDLKSMIRMSTGLTLGTLASVGKQVCDGLAEAHALGIIHRDLKPQNIMIDKGGNAKIMDFGIARSLSVKGITGAGVMIGTPEYMSPEQAEAKEIDARSDIYSLGIVLYEMATGRVPFEGDTALAVAMKHKGELPKSPKLLNSHLPDDLSAVILKCLEKDKAKRYQTAAALRDELDRIEKGIPTTERVVPDRKTITSREITVKFTLRKMLVPGAALLVLALAAVIGLTLLSHKSAPLQAGGKPVLAVMYFKNNTGDKAYDVWRDGLSTALITGLAQSKFLSVLSANDMYGILKKVNLLDAANYDTEDLKNAAAAGKANHAVTGSLSKAGDAFRIDYSVLDLGRDKALGSGSVRGTGENSILNSLVDELVRKIKNDLDLSKQDIAADIDKGIGKITTSSAEAYKYYVEGRRLHNSGQYRDSIALMEKALALDPEFAMAYRAIAISYSNLGFYARRREYMEKALKYSDRLSDSEKFIVQGQYAQVLGRTADAIEAFKKGLDLYPGNELFSIALGNQYGTLEEFAKGAEILEVPRGNRSSNYLIYNNLAAAYAGLGDYDRAIGVVTEFIGNVEDTAPARRQLARLYAESGKLDLALSAVDRAIALNPSDKNAVLLKSEILYYRNDLDAAEKELRPLLDAPELDIKRNAILYVGYIQITRGQLDKAIEQLRQRIPLAKKAGEKIWEVQANFYLTYFYGTLAKDYKKFLELNDEILKFSAESNNLSWKENALFTRAWGLAQFGFIPEALKAAEDVRALYEGDLNKKLIRRYDAAMGKIELERGDFAKAIKYCEDALALSPGGDLTKEAYVYGFLGQVYFRSNELGKARSTFEKIAALTTGRLAYGDYYVRSFYLLGQIDEKLGNKEKAIGHYRKFLDLWKDADPGLPGVEDAKKRLEALK